MKRDSLKRSVYIPVSIIVCLVLAVSLYAAIVNPQPSHNLDGWGTEPFKADAPMRSSAVLTNSYVDTSEVYTAPYARMALCFDVTAGSLTSFEYRVLISKDMVDWFVEATEAVAAGVVTDTEAYYTNALPGNVKYYKVLQCYSPYMKVQVKGTGTVTGSLCAVTYMGVQQ